RGGDGHGLEVGLQTHGLIQFDEDELVPAVVVAGRWQLHRCVGHALPLVDAVPEAFPGHAATYPLTRPKIDLPCVFGGSVPGMAEDAPGAPQEVFDEKTH